MKLFLIFLAVLSTAFAKAPVTETEKYECMANNLKNKKLIDKNFKYYVQSENLDCEPFIESLKEELIQKTLEGSDSSSSGENEEKAEKDKLFKENFECIKKQLLEINYPDLIMKVVVYQKAKKISRRQKKKLVASAEHEATNKAQIAFSMCLSEHTFGEMFDQVMKVSSEEEEETLEDKQSNYCIRKYAIENKLIDTTVYSVNLNPENIDVDIDCSHAIDDTLEALEEVLKEDFETKNKKQLRCLSKIIRTEKTVDYVVKASVLSEVEKTDDQYQQLRSEFIEKFAALFQKLLECM